VLEHEVEEFSFCTVETSLVESWEEVHIAPPFFLQRVLSSIF